MTEEPQHDASSSLSRWSLNCMRPCCAEPVLNRYRSSWKSPATKNGNRDGRSVRPPSKGLGLQSQLPRWHPLSRSAACHIADRFDRSGGLDVVPQRQCFTRQLGVAKTAASGALLLLRRSEFVMPDLLVAHHAGGGVAAKVLRTGGRTARHRMRPVD